MDADIPELAAVETIDGVEVSLDRQIAGGHREPLTAPRQLDLGILRKNVRRDRIEKLDHGKWFDDDKNLDELTAVQLQRAPG